MRRNNPIIKKPNDKVGDILLYNKKICKIIIANGKLYNNNIFPLDKYIPIGIIVVPSSHTYNNMARAVSLAEMDCSNPNKGNTQCHKYINWGGYGYIIDKLGFMNHFPYFKHYTILSNSINIGNWCAMSSDYFNGDFNLFMTKEKYYFKDKNNYAPSPYSEDESKNPLYGDTSDITNVFSDMNGKGNTSKILAVDNSNSTDWQTASTINNESRNEHVHPAAQCCWRYHTVGTNQGDWYLPSAGELGYVVARRKAIDASIAKIQQAGSSALLLSGDGYWSSTQYSAGGAVYLYLNYGNVNGINKSLSNYVRCFLEV